MQSQISFEQTPRVIRANAAGRYAAVLTELRNTLTMCGWTTCDIYALCEKHRISRSLEINLVRLGIIARQGKKDAFSYKALPLLVTITPQDLLARLKALQQQEGEVKPEPVFIAPELIPTAPESEKPADAPVESEPEAISVFAGDWLRWGIGGFVVGCVFGSLLMYLAR